MLKYLKPDQDLAQVIKIAGALEAKHPRIPVGRGLRPHDPEPRERSQPDLQELIAALEAITRLARMEMLALIWVGRGDYKLEQFEEALEYARQNFDTCDVTYMAEKWASLSTYLREGLKQIPTVRPGQGPSSRRAE